MNLWRTGQYLRRFNFTVTRCFSTGTRNYYDVLGISRTANTKEIKEAFYSLSKKYHPDVVGSDSKRFLEIKEAYDTLKDDGKRRLYDSGFNSHGFDEFSHQRPQSDFSRSAYRNVRRDYEFRTNHHYTPDEIEKIWKQFQEQLKNRMNAEYDERTRKQAQDRRYNDYIRNRTYRWEQHAKEHDKKNPYVNPFDNSQNQRGTNFLRKLLGVYFLVFFAVSLFRILFGPMNDTEAKVVIMQNKHGDTSYNYSDSKERLRRMMETPPMNTKEAPQADPNYPYGLPQFGRKE